MINLMKIWMKVEASISDKYDEVSAMHELCQQTLKKVGLIYTVNVE